MPLDFEKIDLGSFGINEPETDIELGPAPEDQARANMSEALKINPDQAATEVKLSRESGVPAFAVKSDPDTVQNKLNFDAIDFDTMSKRSPKTTAFLTDFNNATLAQDDWEPLRFLEDVLDPGKTFENLGEQIKTGFESRGAGFLLAGVDATGQRIEDLVPSSAMPLGMEDIAFQASMQIAEDYGIEDDADLQQVKIQAVDELITELRGIEERRGKLAPEDLNLLEQGVRAGVESLAVNAPAVALGVLTQGRTLPLLAIGTSTYAESYGSGRSEGLTANEATWFAGIDAAIEVGTEILPTGTLERIITGGSEGLTKDALKFAVQEMGTEQLATLGQTVNSYMFGLDEQLEQAETVEEIVNIQLQRQAVTAIATVVAGGAQATAAAAINKVAQKITETQEIEETRAEVEQRKIDQLNEGSERSKLKQRDLETFRQAMNDLDGDQNTTVFIDGAQAALYLQTKTRDEIAQDPALTRLQEQVREAANLGTEVQIPVADFAADFTGTETFEALRDSMTLSADIPAPFRQEQVKQETTNYVQRLLAEADENNSEYAEAQDIYTSVRDQLIDSGVVSPQNASIMAQIVPAWATAYARREGVSVAQAYETAGLRVEGPQTGEAARLSAEVLEQGRQVSESNPFLFEFDPGVLVETETDAKDITDFQGDPSKPITVTERDGKIEILDGHHRARIAKESGTNIRAVVIPKEQVQQMANDGIHQAEMLTEWIARGGGRVGNQFSQSGLNQNPELQRALNMSEEDYLATINPAGKEIDAEDRFTLHTGDLDAPPGSEQIEQFNDSDGTDVQVLRDASGVMYAQQDGEIVGMVSQLGEEETVIDVTEEAKGRGIGKGLMKAYLRENPFAPSGGFTPAGQANRLSAFRELKQEAEAPLRQEPVARGEDRRRDGRDTPDRRQIEQRELYTRNIDEITDPEELRAYIAELRSALLTDERTGLGSNRAWLQREPKAFVASIDLDSLKWVNDNMGHAAGDEMISLVGQAMQEAGIAEDAFHVSGDEFYAQADDAAALEEAMTRAQEWLASQTVSAEGLTFNGPGFSFGIDTEVNNAETKLQENKASRETAGQRAGRGQRPAGVTGRRQQPGLARATSAREEAAAARPGAGIERPATDVLGQAPGQKEPGARGYYDPSQSLIRLTEAADLSTFLHEFAHFMYEMELGAQSDLINSVNGWFKRNDEAVAKEAGEGVTAADIPPFLDDGTTGDQTKDRAIRRAVHEQFARGFETYLMEGKAPSIELRNAFRVFARWLTRIYRAIRGDLSVNLDDDIRQVYDRLLATEEQIAAAEARARYEPMFTDAAMAGMTEEEFFAYTKRQQKVKDKQTETLRDKLIKQLRRQTEAWWKEELQDLTVEETRTLQGEKVYTARRQLRDGNIKLDRATVKEMVGEQRISKRGNEFVAMPPQLNGMTATGQEGVHPDEAAAFFGYGSGSEMLTDIINAPRIQDAAAARAESRMIDKHGDILTDGTIEREADEAVQNEERGRLILDELKALTRDTRQPAMDRQTVKAMAEERIGNLSFREIHPAKYRKAEIRAAQEAAAMLAAGDRQGAAQAKARQVLNYYLGKAASEAKADTVKIVDRMGRYNKKSVREEIQKAEGGYWDQIVKILERFEFRKAATLRQVDAENINTWMADRNGNWGDALVLTPDVLNESYVTHWKNVPYSQLQGINDSVKNIEHVARYANKLTRMGEEIEFNKLVSRWTSSMDEKGTDRFVNKRTDVVEGRNWGRWFMAQMTKIPFMASWLDGGERAGISHDILVQPFTDAYDAEIKLWDAAGRPVMDAITGRSKADQARHNRKIFIPAIGDNLYGHQVLAVALNTGNQGNLRKMLLGEGWADPENDAEITLQNPKLQAVLSYMTESDWQLVQKIWDQMDTLYPQLAEVHRRTTGLVPPKVEATPVETSFGTFRGGYYPVKYDPNRDQRAAENEDRLNAQVESMFSNGASIQASVNTGATEARTGYYAPIRLSLDVVPAHFQETIHYITHHDAVREVNRLIRDKQVASTIRAKLGPEEYSQLRPWLNDIAKDGREAPAKMFWDDILKRLRFGVTLGVMGFKASTGIIQVSGLFNTMSEVGAKKTFQGISGAVGSSRIAQAARRVLGNTTDMQSAWEFAVENSKVLEHRAQTMDREIKSAMQRLENKRGILAAAQEASMKHIALIQTYMVDLPSWHAAYEKGLEQWGDEQRAFQYADWVIENVQGSGATKDLARIMRGQTETGRMFTMFMTFFSSLWNLERDLVKGARAGTYSTTTVAAKVMFLFTLPVLFDMLLRGDLAEPDDGEDQRLQKMLTNAAMYPIQSVPFIRDIASATTGEFGYNISPMQQIIEQGTRSIPGVVEKGFTDEEVTKAEVKGATKFIGAAAGVPGVSQMWATGEHLHDVIVDGEDLTLREVLFGPDRD